MTHYVGLAASAATPRNSAPPVCACWSFLLPRAVTEAQITDGASNTIALVGVSGGLGPWAAGGQATVRR